MITEKIRLENQINQSLFDIEQVSGMRYDFELFDKHTIRLVRLQYLYRTITGHEYIGTSEEEDKN